MNLTLNVPSDLESFIKKRAEEAGVDVQAYVLQSLRNVEEDWCSDRPISDEQFAASLERIKAIHHSANPNFDDSRESIYADRGE